MLWKTGLAVECPHGNPRRPQREAHHLLHRAAVGTSDSPAQAAEAKRTGFCFWEIPEGTINPFPGAVGRVPPALRQWHPANPPHPIQEPPRGLAESDAPKLRSEDPWESCRVPTKQEGGHRHQNRTRLWFFQWPGKGHRVFSLRRFPTCLGPVLPPTNRPPTFPPKPSPGAPPDARRKARGLRS